MLLLGVTLAQLVKVFVRQADVQRFEPHLGHNLLSCGVFLVKSRHFGFPLAQTIKAKLAIFLSGLLGRGGSVAMQTWSIYKVYTLRDKDNYCSKSERVITRCYYSVREGCPLAFLTVTVIIVADYQPELNVRLCVCMSVCVSFLTLFLEP